MFFFKDKPMLIGAVFLLVFSSTSFSYWLLDYSWLEQQRITQLLLLAAASATLLLSYLRRPAAFSSPDNAVLLAFILGLASALLSQYPQWALKEWAKYASSLALIFYLGHALRQTAAQQLVLFILLLTSVLLTLQFFAFYLGRPRKLSATPDLSGTVLPLCPIPNSASKSAPSFNSVKLKASACAALLA